MYIEKNIQNILDKYLELPQHVSMINIGQKGSSDQAKTKALYERPVFRLLGDNGLLVEFGGSIDPAVNARIRGMTIQLEQNLPPGVNELIPTYCALTLIYDSDITSPDSLIPLLLSIHTDLHAHSLPPPQITELPVCYHPSLGPDIGHVARSNLLTPKEVVKIHTEPLYLIYMIGFAPGFPYLGGLPEALHTPRLDTPRTHVPAGSVGIANNQTGIYPLASPGGWQIIGQCPVKLFNPSRTSPVLLRAGDRLKFMAISLNEFQRIKESAQ